MKRVVYGIKSCSKDNNKYDSYPKSNRNRKSIGKRISGKSISIWEGSIRIVSEYIGAKLDTFISG